MTVYINPLDRLAPRTSARQCAPSWQYTLKGTVHGIRKRLYCTPLMPLLNSLHHHQRKTPLPKSLGQVTNTIQSP